MLSVSETQSSGYTQSWFTSAGKGKYSVLSTDFRKMLSREAQPAVLLVEGRGLGALFHGLL